MSDVALSSIELCAGAGMLGEGLRAGLAYLGRACRVVCYVEREAHAAAGLAARIQEGSLDAAPVWSDLLTFDGRRWRGCVDFLAAGFPCQDLSVAGRRAGLDGARSGLFFRVLDVADDCGATGLFLENVGGIASATASVVDEEEGELEERAAARVLGELADRGWHAEWLTLSASDVGASHGRERWFCFAWRDVADAGRARREGGKQHGSRAGEQHGPHAHGPAPQRGGAPLLFAPGPADPRWPAILAEYPHLDPALEPSFRSVVDGLAFHMGDSRAQRLRLVGNGVVALQAATAFVVLARRCGLFGCWR